MRILESLIYVSIIIYLISNIVFINRKKTWQKYIGFLPIALGLLHLIIEGVRWPMLFAYICTLIITSVTIIELKGKKEKEVKRPVRTRVFRMTFLLSVSMTMILPVLFPVKNLLKPTGEYAVGVQNLYFKDDTREEILTEKTDDVRELFATVRYPADSTDGELRSYWTKEEVSNRVFEDILLKGNFFYTHMPLIKTNSQIQAEVSGKEHKFPVIIYSHSFCGVASENTMLCEELASQGYIVVSIGHSYETTGVLLEDGRVLKGDLTYIKEQCNYSEEILDQLQIDMAEKMEATDDVDLKMHILREFITCDELSNVLLAEREKDIIYIIDELEKLNENSGFFAGKMNLDKIGVIGWSFGGNSAISTSMKDDRIDAVVNLDGWPMGISFSNENMIGTPVLLLVSEVVFEDKYNPTNLIWQMMKRQSTEDFTVSPIDGTCHSNFSDFPTVFKAFGLLGLSGGLEDEDLLNTYREYITPFMDQYLK